MIRRSLFVAACVLLAPVAAQPLGGQSVLASRGLGYPLEPLDARSRALGGLTTGASGGVLSVVNPAAVSGISAPAASVTFQQDWYDASGEGLAADGGTARFPLLVIAFPVRGRWSGSVAYGSFLDQNWAATVSDSMDLLTGRVPVVDRYGSSGAVARLRGGVAYSVGPRLALGVAGELYTGAVHDTLTRFIGDLSPAQSSVTYGFSGAGASAGVRWSPLEALGLSAAVTTGGRLTAEAEDSVGERRQYTLPLTVAAGVSARVAEPVEVSASVRWAGWAEAGEELAARGGARDATTLAAGVEYSGFSLMGAEVPLRAGARLNRLPFRWEEDEFPEERALTGGFGLVLARGTALLDFAAERGQRGGEAAGFDEPYWRASVTFSILGR